MDLELSNSTAVVVGGANGIGRAIGEAFAAEGARVAIIDRDSSAPDVARVLAADMHVRSIGVIADVADFAEMNQAASLVQSQLDSVDHVIVAAAIGSGKHGFPFWNLQPTDWETVLRVNIMGAVNVAHAFSPYLVAARRGSMLFLSSVAGQMGSQTDPPYSASKAAILNFAQCAAKDLAEYGVRVNTICPGMVKTALNRSVWESWTRQQPENLRRGYEEWALEKIRRVAPLGRWQEPHEIAAVAVFLASRFGVSITGQAINVDGGQVMHF